MLNFRSRWSSSTTKISVFGAFLLLVALTGGGARDDIQSLILLRPMAFIFIAFGLVTLPKKQTTQLRIPIFLLVALAIWILLQLVPVPYEYWKMLPGRERYAGLLDAAKIDGSYMQATLSPSKSWNSFWSLSIPMATLLLLQNQTSISYRQLLGVLCVIWFLGLIAAIFQLLLGSDSIFYLYRITNGESPVGLFSNRNHFALGLSLMILTLSAYISNLRTEDKYFVQSAIVALALMIMALPMVFLTGSRSGLVLAMITLIIAIYLVYSADFWDTRSKRYQGLVRLRAGIVSAVFTTVIGMIAVIIAFARDRSLDRLLESGFSAGLRGDIIPTLTEMTHSFFPIGSGFGTFEHTYRSFEPESMLSPFYLNNAHNDWFQFLIEGGLPALFLLLVFLFWLLLRARSTWQQIESSGSSKKRVILALSSVSVIGLASATDYPLRVPYIMSYFVTMIALLTNIFRHRKRAV